MIISLSTLPLNFVRHASCKSATVQFEGAGICQDAWVISHNFGFMEALQLNIATCFDACWVLSFYCRMFCPTCRARVRSGLSALRKKRTKIASIASFFDSLWWFATIGEGKAERCYRQHWDALGHLGTHGTWTVGVGPVVSRCGLVFGCWSRDYGKLQLHQAQYPRRRWQQLHQSSWNRHTRDREESWRKRL